MSYVNSLVKTYLHPPIQYRFSYSKLVDDSSPSKPSKVISHFSSPSYYGSTSRNNNMTSSPSFAPSSPSCCLSQWRTIMIVVLPIVFSPVAIFWDDADKPDAGRMAYCSLLMASFWILELVPLAITGILPVFLYPVLGVLSAKKTCGAYFNEVQFIIMGGLIIAIAVEKSR